MTMALAKRKPRDVVFADDLMITWRDGTVGHFPFLSLRDLCPCAQCVDEITGKKVIDKNSIPKDIQIEKAEYVGNYALRIKWSDGHDTGLYGFEFLREIFEQSMEVGPLPGDPHAKQV